VLRGAGESTGVGGRALSLYSHKIFVVLCTVIPYIRFFYFVLQQTDLAHKSFDHEPRDYQAQYK